jgi:hypothetical protein
MRDNQMQGSRPGPVPPPSKTHAADRTCEVSGCETRLSVYNPASRCWQHTDLTFPVYRGKRRMRPGTA